MRRAGIFIAAGLAAMLALAACAPKTPAASAEAPPVSPPPAAGAPAVTVKSLAEVRDLPTPYDDKASPVAIMASIDQAFARAKAADKRVIVDLGGNWCPWCRGLAGVMERPEVKPFIARNFEVVYVDVSSKEGSTDLNQEVRDRFQAKADHFPWLVVAEGDGTVIHSSYEVTDKTNETPQAWVNWLARFAKYPEAKV